MNLWDLFPEYLLTINGILKLPYAAVCLYACVIFLTIKHVTQRKPLSFFLLLTLLSSIFMFANLGPQVGKIIPPLFLLSVIAMPLMILTIKLYKRDYHVVGLWVIAIIAGLLHSLSWSVWLFALARS